MSTINTEDLLVETSEDEAQELIDAMRAAINEVPSYVARDKSQEDDDGE